MAMILSGKEVSEQLQEHIKIRVETLKHTPKLATLRVGENDADKAYEGSATKKFQSLGLAVENVVLEEQCTQEEFVAQLQTLGEQEDIHGILVFQPLPSHLSVEVLRTSLNPMKDVDCSTFENLGKLLSGNPRFIPGAPGAVMMLLQHFQIDVAGKNIALIGRSTVVGRPLGQLLTTAGATVTMCHSKSKDLASICKQSDILITSAGVPNLVTKEFVHGEQIVIDVSTNVVDGKLCGDIDPDIAHIVKAYTPTPGGIGAVTTAVLAHQVVRASESV